MQAHSLRSRSHDALTPTRSLAEFFSDLAGSLLAGYLNFKTNSYFRRFCFTMLSDWLKNSRHFVIQSQVKPKLIRGKTRTNRDSCVASATITCLAIEQALVFAFHTRALLSGFSF